MTNVITRATMPPSLEVIRRTLAAEDAYALARIRVLERIAGNPIGVAYRAPADGVIAMMARHLPSPSFNSVRGLVAGHEPHVAPLVAWYRAHGVKPRFELVPGLAGADLARALHRLDYCVSDFHTSLIAEADRTPPARGPAVERVAHAAAMENFLDAYMAGWGLPKDHAQLRANVRPWLHEPGWSLYVARLDGRPAAAAVLFVERGVGYFADSATDPAARGHGLQTALLAHRWHEARAAGADIVCSGAAFLSASHRNMERLGMRIQFTRALWTECPTTS